MTSNRFSKKQISAIVILLVGGLLLSFGAWYYLTSENSKNEEVIESLKISKKILNEDLEKMKILLKEKEIEDKLLAEQKLAEESETEEEVTPKPEPEAEPTPTPAPTPPATPPPSTANWWDYPATIIETPLANVNTQTIVNKGNKLPSTYAPTDLVLLSAMPGLRVTKTLYVRNIIIEPLRKMVAAAQADGIDLSAISAYRSYQTQESTYQYWVNYNGGSSAAADQVSARPGHSEHQLGTVVDFSSSEIGDAIGSSFHNTNAASWLANNAPSYGFRLSYPQGQEANTGYTYESWHWRYWGN